MNKNKLKKLINKEYTYPEYDDPNFQLKIYKKREYYYHKIPEEKKLKSYEQIKEYRDNICGTKFRLYNHQSFLSNFINPNTPYKGLLLFHGVGTGKTGAAISIAENFKYMVKKYNTKIHILVPGPLLKENWKDEIIKFTGKDYMKDIINQIGYLDEHEENIAKKNALKEALQYYKIVTHRSFYKKVLGEKIRATLDIDETKKKYRMNEDGEIERDISIDKIDTLDNTLLIIDEAHNFTGNEHGDALKKIIKKSKNLRLLLLTATPMKNKGDDIIELINFLRPHNDQIRRDKIFNSKKNYLMNFKEGGKEYFQKMCNGYISYYRGANPLLFAKRVDEGEIPDGLIFTKLIRCKMLDFQYKTYKTVAKKTEDALERNTSAVSNIVLPGLSKDKKSIEGYYGENGINVIKSNLKTNKLEYLNKLNKLFFKNKIKNVEDIVYESRNTDSITGLIYKKENLKYISGKFDKVFENINSKVEGKRKSGTIFVYSNLVKVGIEVFQEILLQNGYLEFKEDGKYDISSDTIHYRTGIEYEKFIKKYPNEKFFPATFIRITGKTDDMEEDLPDAKKKILDNYYNNIENIEGKLLKIILGSRVMNEGITLENTSEVHILDVYYNLGRVEQVIGRAIRQCKHYNVTNKNNPFPEVKIFKYVVIIKNDLSAEEHLYRKAELKYLLVKQVERAMKEVAIDCPINYNANVFIEEVKNNKNCYKPEIGKKIPKNKKICPEKCDFLDCNFLCKNNKLNLKYYNKNSNLYKKINKLNLDYTTFTEDLAINEIITTKEKIKELFRIKYVYTLREILVEIKKTYKDEQSELFEDFFVYKALNDLVPRNESDFINFNDTIYDKYNIPGYLIYRGYFYIFQPFEQDDDVPMFYRRSFTKELINQLSLYSFLKSSKKFNEIQKIKKDIETKMEKGYFYDFNKNKSYYDKRKEFDIVGIIDKLTGARKITIGKEEDVFKIRPKRAKELNIKRGTGIPSIKGAVCYSSKDKNELKKISNKINMDNYNRKDTRINTCLKIRDRLLYLEKYSTGKDIMTYMVIPNNHKTLIFPYNLIDRIKYVEDNFNENENSKIKLNYKKEKNGIFMGKKDKKLVSYSVNFSYSKNISNKSKKLLDKYNLKKKGNKWSAIFN